MPNDRMAPPEPARLHEIADVLDPGRPPAEWTPEIAARALVTLAYYTQVIAAVVKDGWPAPIADSIEAACAQLDTASGLLLYGSVYGDDEGVVQSRG